MDIDDGSSRWSKFLNSQVRQPYFSALSLFLRSETENGKIIYPPESMRFRAFQETPFDQLKVIILGQDPYHQPGQANGLAFSVPTGVKFPPTLRNIFSELQSDCRLPQPTSGDLSKWAQQGVLLLNTTLTVEDSKPASHVNKGWETLTRAVIIALSQEKDHLVFLLWGKHAMGFSEWIDRDKHLILTAAHPSPLSCHRGFAGCRHFTQANRWLQEKGLEPIDWSLT